MRSIAAGVGGVPCGVVLTGRRDGLTQRNEERGHVLLEQHAELAAMASLP